MFRTVTFIAVLCCVVCVAVLCCVVCVDFDVDVILGYDDVCMAE